MEETKPKLSKTARRFGYAVAIAINLGLLYLFNRYIPGRNFPFLTDDYEGVLGIFNVSIAFAIFSNIVWICYDPRWLKSALQIIQNLLGIAFMLAVYTIFPFNFSGYSPSMGQWVHWAVILGIAGACIGVLAEVVKLFFRSTDD